MQIIIKNKSKFNNFLKKNLKEYNTTIKQNYLNDLIDKSLNQCEGLNDYELRRFKTKTGKPELIYYNASLILKPDDEIVILEF